MTGVGLRVMEAFSVTFIYLFSYRTFYKTINNPQPYTIKEDINYKLKAMDCVKALRTADLRGRVKCSPQRGQHEQALKPSPHSMV